MQKTAVKVFLYSFSVSLFVMWVTNNMILRHKNIDSPSVIISEKNISLFVKDLKPKSFPIKKIDLTVLDDPMVHKTIKDQNLALDDNNDDAIILADEDNFPQIYPLEETGSYQVDNEDQTIFLADVVYSQDKPLEQIAINKETVYAPESLDIKSDVSEINTPDDNKAVVYAENMVATESKAQFAEPEKAETFTEALPDSPLPLIIDEKAITAKNIETGNPDQLSHIAMKSGNTPIESMISDNADDKTTSEDWHQMKDNPWVVAKSNGVGRNKFAQRNLGTAGDSEITEALNIHKPKAGVEVAAETVKNLIIPLPDKLAEDEDLMPKLAYPEGSDEAKKEKAMNALSLKMEKEKSKLVKEIDDDSDEYWEWPDEEKEDEVKPVETKAGFLSSLGALLSNKAKPAKNQGTKTAVKRDKNSARHNLKLAANARRGSNIVPREIRMAFQNNRAEISGQTLRWVQAFALKAAKEENIYLEVRVDGSRQSLLQQRRLNLLYNILTNKGVEYSKIKVVYTVREPNSFILRMVNFDEKGNLNKEKSNKSGINTLQW